MLSETCRAAYSLGTSVSAEISSASTRSDSGPDAQKAQDNKRTFEVPRCSPDHRRGRYCWNVLDALQGASPAYRVGKPAVLGAVAKRLRSEDLEGICPARSSSILGALLRSRGCSIEGAPFRFGSEERGRMVGAMRPCRVTPQGNTSRIQSSCATRRAGHSRSTLSRISRISHPQLAT